MFKDAQAKLQEIVDNDLLNCRAGIGLYRANGIDNDRTELYSDIEATNNIETLNHLRQQVDRPYRSLADFIAPKESGVTDYMGAFVVGCFGAEALAKEYEANTMTIIK